MPPVEYTGIRSDELRNYLRERKESDFVLVDVRQPAEYRQGHIPGAKLIPLGELETAMAGLDGEKDHIFYCHSGGRSRAAAVFAAESGRFSAGVFNLEGGFARWSGFGVPDLPRLEIFAGKSLEQRLMAALDLEKGAYLLYRNLAERTGSDFLCEIADRVLDMEKAHARVVYGKLKRTGADPGDFEPLFERLPGRILEGGKTVEELEPWIAAAGEDCMEFADLALEVEFAAYDLYRAVANDVEDEETREVFLDLAQQEKQHARIIMEYLDRFAGQEESVR